MKTDSRLRWPAAGATLLALISWYCTVALFAAQGALGVGALGAAALVWAMYVSYSLWLETSGFGLLVAASLADLRSPRPSGQNKTPDVDVSR